MSGKTKNNTRTISRVYFNEVKDNCDGSFTITTVGETPKGNRISFKVTHQYSEWPFLANDLLRNYTLHRERHQASIEQQDEAFGFKAATF